MISKENLQVANLWIFDGSFVDKIWRLVKIRKVRFSFLLLHSKRVQLCVQTLRVNN